MLLVGLLQILQSGRNSANSKLGDFSDEDNDLSESEFEDSSFADSDTSETSEGSEYSNFEEASIAGNRVGRGVNDTITLHDPVIHGHLHCPPFNSIEHTIYGVCDCEDYGMAECCQNNNFVFFRRLTLDDEYMMSLNSVDDQDRTC